MSWQMAGNLSVPCSSTASRPRPRSVPKGSRQAMPTMSGCGLTENQGEALGLGFDTALEKHEEEGLLGAEKSAPGDDQGRPGRPG